jgi:hypothetical protein
MPSGLTFPTFTADTLPALLEQVAAEGQHAVLTQFRTSLRDRR